MLAYNVFTATRIELNRRTLLTPLRTFMRDAMRAVSNSPTMERAMFFRVRRKQLTRLKHDAIEQNVQSLELTLRLFCADLSPQTAPKVRDFVVGVHSAEHAPQPNPSKQHEKFDATISGNVPCDGTLWLCWLW
jgi:hypothetical protein